MICSNSFPKTYRECYEYGLCGYESFESLKESDKKQILSCYIKEYRDVFDFHEEEFKKIRELIADAITGCRKIDDLANMLLEEHFSILEEIYEDALVEAEFERKFDYGS